MSESDYATDAEVAEALDQGRKEAADKLAKKAASEIMDAAPSAVDGGPPPLQSGQYPIPDPPTDTILESIYQAMTFVNARSSSLTTSHDRDEFDKMIREKFLEHGIVVDVKWYETNVDNVYMPEVEPYGVTDLHGRSVAGHADFDPDEQVYNVVSDKVLQTGKSGIIKGSGTLWTP